MTTTSPTLATLAADARRHFDPPGRGPLWHNGGADNAWIRALVDAAHGQMTWNEWRFNAIARVLDRIADSGCPAPTWHLDFCTQLVDHALPPLTAWLASHVRRPLYVNAAIRQHGQPPHDEGFDLLSILQMGQCEEYVEILVAVVDALSTRLDHLQRGEM